MDYPLDGAQIQAFRQLEERTLASAAIAVAALGVGLLWIDRRSLVRPLRELMRATERIAGGDLGYRVPARRPDELGLLAASFNEMTDSLAGARAEIQGLMDGLEKTVEERTAALRETQAQLVNAAKLASLGRLAASIAHEINNPLAGILTFARLMLRELEEGDLPEEQRERYLKNLRLIERETQRCTTIVRNLLYFARQRPLTLTEADVNTVIEEALSLVGHQIELKGVELAKQLGSLPPIKADFGQIRQAFINIILTCPESGAWKSPTCWPGPRQRSLARKRAARHLSACCSGWISQSMAQHPRRRWAARCSWRAGSSCRRTMRPTSTWLCAKACTLATLDEDLIKAAKRAGVKRFDVK